MSLPVFRIYYYYYYYCTKKMAFTRTSWTPFIAETLCQDGRNRFELHQEWEWKDLLMMDIVGENMARKTSLEPCTRGKTKFNPHKLLCLYSKSNGLNYIYIITHFVCMQGLLQMYPQKCSRLHGNKASAKIRWRPHHFRNHLPRKTHLHNGQQRGFFITNSTRKPGTKFEQHKYSSASASAEYPAKPWTTTKRTTSEPAERVESPNRKPRFPRTTISSIPFPFVHKHKKRKPCFSFPCAWKLHFSFLCFPCCIRNRPLDRKSVV